MPVVVRHHRGVQERRSSCFATDRRMLMLERHRLMAPFTGDLESEASICRNRIPLSGTCRFQGSKRGGLDTPAGAAALTFEA